MPDRAAADPSAIGHGPASVVRNGPESHDAAAMRKRPAVRDGTADKPVVGGFGEVVKNNVVVSNCPADIVRNRTTVYDKAVIRNCSTIINAANVRHGKRIRCTKVEHVTASQGHVGWNKIFNGHRNTRQKDEQNREEQHKLFRVRHTATAHKASSEQGDPD